MSTRLTLTGSYNDTVYQWNQTSKNLEAHHQVNSLRKVILTWDKAKKTVAFNFTVWDVRTSSTKRFKAKLNYNAIETFENTDRSGGKWRYVKFVGDYHAWRKTNAVLSLCYALQPDPGFKADEHSDDTEPRLFDVFAKTVDKRQRKGNRDRDLQQNSSLAYLDSKSAKRFDAFVKELEKMERATKS